MPINVAVYNLSGKKVGEAELNEEIFGVEVNEHCMHLVVKAHLANKRQGTQSALTRSEVRGGGIKPWKQKGTGRARQGSTRSPQWKHGGVVFAPKPRDYSMSVNKKVRRLAMKSALTTKAAEESIIIFEDLNISAPKTKEMVKVLDAVSTSNALVVLPQKQDEVRRAANNLPKVKTTLVSTLNVYDILKYDKLILTKDALKKVEEVYA